MQLPEDNGISTQTGQSLSCRISAYLIRRSVDKWTELLSHLGVNKS